MSTFKKRKLNARDINLLRLRVLLIIALNMASKVIFPKTRGVKGRSRIRNDKVLITGRRIK